MPSELWQIAHDTQQPQLERLVSTYWSFKHVLLTANSQQEVQPPAVHRAARMLAGIAALTSIQVNSIGPRSSCWSALLEGLAILPATVKTLHLTDVKLPGPEGLDSLVKLSNIQALTFTSAHSNKLQQQHVLAISKMQQLQRLSLGFRTVSGSLLEPLTLDCLGQLKNLRHLEIRYKGKQITGLHSQPLFNSSMQNQLAARYGCKDCHWQLAGMQYSTSLAPRQHYNPARNGPGCHLLVQHPIHEWAQHFCKRLEC